MKIKLGILESDLNYLQRINTALTNKYAEKLEIYMYTKKELLVEELASKSIDVLLISENIAIDIEALDSKCSVAYLSEKSEVQTINERAAISKYQKVDTIYKDILGMYSENATHILDNGLDHQSGDIILFGSPCGGVGSSSLAMASSIKLTKMGYRVLYLNLEKLGDTSTMFDADEQHTLSDVIFALKSKKANMHIKLESCLCQDSKGVCYFASANSPLDVMELTTEEELELVNYIKQNGEYDYIIIDKEFGLDDKYINMLKVSNCGIWVSDGSHAANIKIRKAYEVLQILMKDKMDERKLGLIYNKFSSKTGKSVDVQIKEIGGAPKFEGGTVTQTINKLVEMEFYKHMI